VLAPYSVSGVLTGVTYKASDPGVQRLLDQWRQIFPLSRRKASPAEGEDGEGGVREKEERGGEEQLPPAVEVIIGEEIVKMLLDIFWELTKRFFLYVKLGRYFRTSSSAK